MSCLIGLFNSWYDVWFSISVSLISVLYLNDIYVARGKTSVKWEKKKCRQKWLEICVGLPCRSPCPYCILQPAHIYPNAWFCRSVTVSLYTHIHMQNGARTSPPHFHTLLLTLHPLTLPTHSHVSVCLQSHLSICFFFCVFYTLRFYIYPPLPLISFSSLRPCGLSKGWAPNVRLAASSQHNSRHLSSELSWFLVLCDISICGDLTSVVSRTSHCPWAGESTANAPLKERMSGHVCTHSETTSHAFCIECECLHL